MSGKIGVGLIGCGGRLRGVVDQLLKATDQVEILAVCDPSAEAIEATRRQFNPAAKAYADYRELVQDPRLQWVMIGSWNKFHAEQTVAAFAAGKHVFCEKPLATSAADCLAMREAWKKSGRLFSIGFTLRYSPHYRKIKELLRAGAVGRIVSFEFNETLHFDHGGYIHADWRRHTDLAGTHLLEKCCHDVDLANWMIESQAMRVASFGGCDFFRPENVRYIDQVGRNEKGQTAFSTWRKGPNSLPHPFNDDKDIVDNQVAILQYANGVRATFHTNCSTAISERRMYICGTDGTLRADLTAGLIETRQLGYGREIERHVPGHAGGHGGGDEVLGVSLADSMLRGAAPLATLEDGLRSAFTCYAIDQAMAEGQVVDLLPLWQQAGIEPVGELVGR